MERIPKQPQNKNGITNELFIRLEMSTDKLRSLVEKIKGTDFEKEVINNIYFKFPEYVNICKPTSPPLTYYALILSLMKKL
jgi:hypothetical protein